MAGLIPVQLLDLLSDLLSFTRHAEYSTGSIGLPTSDSVIVTSTPSSLSLGRSPSTASTSLLLSSLTSLILGASFFTSTPTPTPTTVLITRLASVPATSAPTPTFTPSPASILVPVERTLDGSTFYVTITSSVYPRPSVALILVVIVVALRREKRNRMHDETGHLDSEIFKSRLDRDSIGKRRFSILSSDIGRDSPSLPSAARGHQDFCHLESQHIILTQSRYSCHRGDTNGLHHTVHIQFKSCPTQLHGSNRFLLLLAPVKPT